MDYRLNLNDNGKTPEKVRRKAKGPKAHQSKGSLATETGFIY